MGNRYFYNTAGLAAVYSTVIHTLANNNNTLILQCPLHNFGHKN